MYWLYNYSINLLFQLLKTFRNNLKTRFVTKKSYYAYNDEQLTDIYSPIGYPKNDECTDEKGYYRYSRVSRTHLEVCDVYVVAIDTTGIYERQVKKGQIEYVVVPIVDDQTGVTGSATVDFVLKKKQ